MSGDPELFESLEERDDSDIDLFGDFDQPASSDIGDVSGALSPEELSRSIENFYQIFSNREERMNAASGAILLYQHLMTAGYKTDIMVSDGGATVTASTRSDQLKSPLLERVEFLLSDMVYMRRSWKLSGFTVHSISTNSRDDCVEVRIEFISL